jgi:hypothetical protein
MSKILPMSEVLFTVIKSIDKQHIKLDKALNIVSKTICDIKLDRTKSTAMT